MNRLSIDPRFSIGLTLLFAATLALYASAGTQPQPQAVGILIFVDSTGDDVNTGSGNVCDDGTGHCTLRAAIQLVNARNNGADSIVISATGTITLNSALPNLSVPVSINGPGADSLTVMRGSSIFRIFNVTSSGTVNLSGLTIRNGLASGGGGIQNASTGVVNLTNCTISGNQATNGGGISNVANGRVFITNCLIKDNNSALTNGRSYGGGISNLNGYMNITNSTLSYNTATGNGYGNADIVSGAGGGVYNDGTLIVVGSAIYSNTATSSHDTTYGFGGGVYNYGQLEITNSTIIANTATSAPDYRGETSGDGGGIANLGTAVVITNDTIAYNFAYSGGGIENIAGQVQVKSTIIAQNNASPAYPDVSGSFTSAGFNLIGATDGSTGFTAATDQTGVAASPLDPKFEPDNVDNGGPTETLGLVCGSPAMDKGTSNGLTGTLTTDQRGTGFARTVNEGMPQPPGGDGTDIGAFEFGAGPIMPTRVVSRKFHGSAGSFDIPLPLSCGSMGIECRRNTGSDTSGLNAGHDHELIVTFARNVTVSSADVASSSSSSPFPVGSATFTVSNNVVTVDLHNMPNAARLTVNLRGVSDGMNTGLVSIPMGVLLGDVNGSGVVTSGDTNLCKGQALQPVTTANFRNDINASGAITSGDTNLIKQHALDHLP